MKPEAYITEPALTHFVNAALQEDIGEGDHSSLSAIPKEAMNTAHLLCKDEGIVAGVQLVEFIFGYIDSHLAVKTFYEDGKPVNYGDVILEVSGSVRSILKAERLVLNCIQRMSGIATYTHKVVEHLRGTGTKVLDTRKTTPNFRVMEKWAVAIGGGQNHRLGLYDMIMLKDNHIDYAGGITQAVQSAKQYVRQLGKPLKIEVETRNIKEVQEALATKSVDIIMLDNMNIERMKEAVQLIGNQAKTEASGGITLETVKEVATSGVDFISMGAVTYSAQPLDFSLKAKK